MAVPLPNTGNVRIQKTKKQTPDFIGHLLINTAGKTNGCSAAACFSCMVNFYVSDYTSAETRKTVHTITSKLANQRFQRFLSDFIGHLLVNTAGKTNGCSAAACFSCMVNFYVSDYTSAETRKTYGFTGSLRSLNVQKYNCLCKHSNYIFGHLALPFAHIIS